MNVLIRTDASTEIGSGHVMRCLVLAEAMRSRGATVRFVCRELDGNLIVKIKQQQFDVIALPQSCDVAEEDAQLMLKAIEGKPVDLVVVDHYGLDRQWEQRVRASTSQILVIDDIADRPHDADYLLDQNCSLHPDERYQGLLPAHCTLLTGPQYALLRPQFEEKRSGLKRKFGHVRRILVSFGGSDPGNMTGLVLDALDRLLLEKVSVDVVLGSICPHLEKIREVCEGNEKYSLHVDVADMASLIARADMGIGAGGVSALERCSLELPSLVFAIASNQRPGLAAMAHRGVIVAPDETDIDATYIARHIQVLMENVRWRESMSLRAAKLCDAKGVSRVINRVLKPAIEIRSAQMSDADLIYHWRNSEEVRKFTLDDREIPAQQHRHWLKQMLSSEQCALLIGHCQGEEIGVIRFDIDELRAVVSIYLSPTKTGHGLGAGLLMAGERWLQQHHPLVTQIDAHIIPDNQRSIRLFLNAGYITRSTLYRKQL